MFLVKRANLNYSDYTNYRRNIVCRVDDEELIKILRKTQNSFFKEL